MFRFKIFWEETSRPSIISNCFLRKEDLINNPKRVGPQQDMVWWLTKHILGATEVVAQWSGMYQTSKTTCMILNVSLMTWKPESWVHRNFVSDNWISLTFYDDWKLSIYFKVILKIKLSKNYLHFSEYHCISLYIENWIRVFIVMKFEYNMQKSYHSCYFSTECNM